MLGDKLITFRMALLAELVEESSVRIGRTALMKLCYFLQTLYHVQLGYEFSLYSYGPFDSEVLSDLQQAESMSVIFSEMFVYSGGYQYQLSTGPEASEIKHDARKFLDEHKDAIRSVVSTFSSKSASELELLSTIVYADREKNRLSVTALRDRVKQIKPHFSSELIEGKIEWLIAKNLLVNVVP